MITDAMLRMFCSNDETSETLNNPFNDGDYTYATNGHILIRVPRRAEYDQNKAVKNINEAVQFTAVPEEKWIDTPDPCDTIKTEPCNMCKGTGKLARCPDCKGQGEVQWESDYGYEYEDTCRMCNGRGRIDGICEDCAGTGKITTERNIEICGRLLNGKLLSILRELPGLKIAPDAVENLKPIPFKCDGGEGVIMQMPN